MKEQPYLSIIVPAYKEEKRIHTVMEAIAKYIKSKDFPVEVIVIIDGSTDNTPGAAKAFSDRIPNLTVTGRTKNRGKGFSVGEGMMLATGKYILFADADNSTPVEQVDKLLKYAESAQVVIGSRYCADGKLAIPQSFVRRAGARALNLVIQTLAVSGIADTQCGFKLFEQKAAKEIFKRQTIFGFSFDVEILAIAKFLGYKIKEVGITWYDDANSHVNPLRDGLKMVRDAWLVRKNIITGVYR